MTHAQFFKDAFDETEDMEDAISLFDTMSLCNWFLAKERSCNRLITKFYFIDGSSFEVPSIDVMFKNC